jgi:hypothetical protein
LNPFGIINSFGDDPHLLTDGRVVTNFSIKSA